MVDNTSLVNLPLEEGDQSEPSEVFPSEVLQAREATPPKSPEKSTKIKISLINTEQDQSDESIDPLPYKCKLCD